MFFPCPWCLVSFLWLFRSSSSMLWHWKGDRGAVQVLVCNKIKHKSRHTALAWSISQWLPITLTTNSKSRQQLARPLLMGPSFFSQIQFSACLTLCAFISLTFSGPLVCFALLSLNDPWRWPSAKFFIAPRPCPLPHLQVPSSLSTFSFLSPW